MDRFGHTQEKNGEACGKAESHICELTAAFNLPENVLELVRQGDLTAGNARTFWFPSKNPEKSLRKADYCGRLGRYGLPKL